VPAGHPYHQENGTENGNGEGAWLHLDEDSRHPTEYHHLIFTVHEDRIWTFGGHEEEFSPTDPVYVFTPDSPDAPEGSWSGIRVSDGEPCDLSPPGSPLEGEEQEAEEEGAEAEAAAAADDDCLRLPEPRAAGFAVSHGGGIYVFGGVVENEAPRDPANEAIRADDRVYSLDTAQFPLQWQEMPSMNEPREHFNAVVVEERIYAVRGRNEESPRMRGLESWAPGEEAWQQEEEAPIGGSAGIVAAIDQCIYAFGGEFTPFTHTGTLRASQVFHVPSGAWRTLDSDVQDEPLDASDVLHLHGVFAATFEEEGQTKILVAGGGDEAWGSPISKVHIFTPPEGCE
jgi:N-acetylneuraminic acid mutarotase